MVGEKCKDIFFNFIIFIINVNIIVYRTATMKQRNPLSGSGAGIAMPMLLFKTFKVIWKRLVEPAGFVICSQCPLIGRDLLCHCL